MGIRVYVDLLFQNRLIKVVFGDAGGRCQHARAVPWSSRTSISPTILAQREQGAAATAGPDEFGKWLVARVAVVRTRASCHMHRLFR